jgi:hypothetical protein
MKCMPAEPTGNDCACFCAWKNPSSTPVSPGLPIAMTTYNIQNAHHFQQKNRRELACRCGLQNSCYSARASVLLVIGAVAFGVGMAIHNEAIAQQIKPRPEPIYYCATGAELPAFEPCKEMKGTRDI